MISPLKSVPPILSIRLDKPVEISTSLRAKSEMPFTYGCSSITFGLEHVGHCSTFCIDYQLGVTRSNTRIFLTPWIHTSQYAETRRCAGGRGSVGICEPESLACQTVYIWSMDFCRAIATEVAYTEVISNKEYYVRIFLFVFRLIFRTATGTCAKQRCS